ncbi:type IV conjugative transfer system protein TraE [Acidovorax sp. LjRoot129]|uniref:TraE/TraK family type IV conjugative transfer system protein n=1 Tax=unclassified Acidovorax TaxID=2684926 RepID=UPI003ED0CE33
MNFKSALRNMSELQALTRVLVVSNAMLVAALVYAFAVMSGERERIVLVPPMLDQKAEVAWNSANKEYIKSFGMYIATLVGNIQPKSSQVVLDSVSAFMDPSIYTDFRRQLMTIMEDPVFKGSGSVISFLPNSLQFEADTSRVFVSGTLITSTSGAQKYQKQVTYEMGISIREGRPWVSHFLSYEGTIPRTVAWHVNRSSREGGVIPDYATPSRYKKNGGKPQEDALQALDLDAMKPATAPIQEAAQKVSEQPVQATDSATGETLIKEQN